MRNFHKFKRSVYKKLQLQRLHVKKTTVRYVVMNDTKAVFMLIFPNEYSKKICNNYETVRLCENGFPNHCDW